MPFHCFLPIQPILLDDTNLFFIGSFSYFFEEMSLLTGVPIELGT